MSGLENTLSFLELFRKVFASVWTLLNYPTGFGFTYFQMFFGFAVLFMTWQFVKGLLTGKSVYVSSREGDDLKK